MSKYNRNYYLKNRDKLLEKQLIYKKSIEYNLKAERFIKRFENYEPNTQALIINYFINHFKVCN